MLRSPNRTPQNYKEKFSKHDFFKKRGQNILKLTDSVEKGQNFWNLGVSIGETFFGLTVPSQTMCTFNQYTDYRDRGLCDQNINMPSPNGSDFKEIV